MFGSADSASRTHAPYRRLSACARGDQTAGPAAAIEQLELNAGRVDREAHQPAERVDLADEMALGRAANRRIARHQRDRLRRQRAEPDAAPQPRRRPRRFASGMPAPMTMTSKRRSHWTRSSRHDSLPDTEPLEDVPQQIVRRPPARDLFERASRRAEIGRAPVPRSRRRRAPRIARSSDVARAVDERRGGARSRSPARRAALRDPSARRRCAREARPAPRPSSPTPRRRRSPRQLRVRGCPGARQVGLARDDDRSARRDSATMRRSAVGDRLTAVDDDERERGDAARLTRALDALGLDRVRASRRPAVSTSVTGMPPTSTRSVSTSRVVPGTSVTIARAAPTSALNRLDLPAFGRPDDDDQPALAEHAAGAALARAAPRASP